MTGMRNSKATPNPEAIEWLEEQPIRYYDAVNAYNSLIEDFDDYGVPHTTLFQIKYDNELHGSTTGTRCGMCRNALDTNTLIVVEYEDE